MSAKIIKFIKKYYNKLKKISIIDKILIIFMLILLLQSGHNLFANMGDSEENNSIDVIVRTSSASIFGYFLSSNFSKDRADKSDANGENKISDVEPEKIINSAEQEKKIIRKSLNNSPKANQTKAYTVSYLQILIMSAIGVFSLVILLIVRNCVVVTPEMAAPSALGTIAQFRDFVSGCIGFLIGSAKNDFTS